MTAPAELAPTTMVSGEVVTTNGSIGISLTTKIETGTPGLEVTVPSMLTYTFKVIAAEMMVLLLELSIWLKELMYTFALLLESLSIRALISLDVSEVVLNNAIVAPVIDKPSKVVEALTRADVTVAGAEVPSE